jgi:hypothetical protein
MGIMMIRNCVCVWEIDMAEQAETHVQKTKLVLW